MRDVLMSFFCCRTIVSSKLDLGPWIYIKHQTLYNPSICLNALNAIVELLKDSHTVKIFLLGWIGWHQAPNSHIIHQTIFTVARLHCG